MSFPLRYKSITKICGYGQRLSSRLFSYTHFFSSHHLWDKLYLKVLRFSVDNHENISQSLPTLNQSTNRSDDPKLGQLHHNERPAWSFLFTARQPLAGQGLKHCRQSSRSHSHAPHSVGCLLRSGQSDAEITTWRHTRLTKDRRPSHGWDSNPRSQQASGRRPTH